MKNHLTKELELNTDGIFLFQSKNLHDYKEIFDNCTCNFKDILTWCHFVKPTQKLFYSQLFLIYDTLTGKLIGYFSLKAANEQNGSVLLYSCEILPIFKTQPYFKLILDIIKQTAKIAGFKQLFDNVDIYNANGITEFTRNDQGVPYQIL